MAMSAAGFIHHTIQRFAETAADMVDLPPMIVCEDCRSCFNNAFNFSPAGWITVDSCALNPNCLTTPSSNLLTASW